MTGHHKCYKEPKDPQDYVFLVTPILLFLNYFNWRVITLQYCDGFCHRATGMSHRYTYVPSLLNLAPTFLPISHL